MTLFDNFDKPMSGFMKESMSLASSMICQALFFVDDDFSWGRSTGD
jgi:hypothetical protein